MYVNFTKVQIKDIEGKEQMADFSAQLGNQLYMTGLNIDECELGKRIYFAKGDMELNEKEIQTVKNALAGWSYVARTAIEEAMKE